MTASVQGLEVYPLRDRLLHLHGKGAQVRCARTGLSQIRHSTFVGRPRLLCDALTYTLRLLGVKSRSAASAFSVLLWVAVCGPTWSGRYQQHLSQKKAMERERGMMVKQRRRVWSLCHHVYIIRHPATPRSLCSTCFLVCLRMRRRCPHRPSWRCTALSIALISTRMESASRHMTLAAPALAILTPRFCRVETSEVRAVLRDLRGSYVSKGQARRFMQLLDKNSDGVLTLEEFSKAIARRAKGTIPIEHDLGEIVSAEFVALALRWMGLLPTQRRESKRLLLSSLAVSIHVPQSPIKGGQQLKPDTLSTVEHFTPTSFSSAQVSPPLVLAGAELGTEHMVAVSIREEA